MPETTDLMAGQIWTPEPGRRAKAREIVKLDDRYGVPHVFWSEFYPNYGHTDTSSMTVSSFRDWIRRRRATVNEQMP